MAWRIMEFKTREQMERFIDLNYNKIQWQEVFIDNGYGIEYRPLRKVG
jgi:hypothetical protein